MVNDVLRQACEQVEFHSFPMTDSLIDNEQAPIIELTEKFNCRARPKMMHNADLFYAVGVLNVDT